MHRRAVLAAALCAYAKGTPQAQAPDAGAAAIALRDARALAARGQPGAALARLERAVAALRTAPEPDILALRLEAARMAVAAADPDRARSHLTVSERLVGAAIFRAEPLLVARLRRDLARLRESIGDMAAVERLLGLALPRLEEADAAAAADALNARGVARLELLRLAEAARDFERSLALLRRGGATGELLVVVLCNIAVALAEGGKGDAALVAAEQAREAAGGDALLVLAADCAEGQARQRRLETGQADALLARVAAEAPPSHPLRGHALLALALARFDRGHMAEAANDALAAVEAYRASLGEHHPAFGRALHVLGTAQAELGDAVRAAATLARASAVLREALGSLSAQHHATEIERGWIDLRGGIPASAGLRARAALAAYAANPPPDRRPHGLASVLLGLAAEAQGRNDAAVRLFREGQALIESARGADSPDLGFSLIRLGRLLTRWGRLAEAGAPIDRAIAIYARVGGAGSVRLADAITARAELRARLGLRQGALEDTRRGLALLRERIGGPDPSGAASDAQRRGVRELFGAQARLLLALAPGDADATEDAFSASQQALTSRAGEALRRAAVRRSLGDGALPGLLRTQSAAADALRQADAAVFAAASRPGGTAVMRDAVALRDRVAIALREAERTLTDSFPAFAAFLAPRPITIAEAQATLEQEEALLAPLASEAGLLVWVLRRDAVRTYTTTLGPQDLAQLVRRIRAGVDLGLAGAGRDLPPFDVAAARELYAALLGAAEAEGLLESARHLILVPDGALQQLPIHLLLQGDRWLAQRYAATVVPSVGAAVAAREAARRPSRAPMAFLGVADPVFDNYAGNALLARRGPPEGLRRELAQLDRLPETAEEVRRIAALYDNTLSQLVLQQDASERGVLAAQPARFRVISFATHALMAGELPGLAEPAIVLTPDDDDAPLDGLLTASDVAALELDADLVMLSACNTAAPDSGPYAEGMSGLARAFLQAGARSLLVSHWAVQSEATVALTTGFAAEVARGYHGAEALRRTIVTMIDGQDLIRRHPALWAPFVVVGGSIAGRR